MEHSLEKSWKPSDNKEPTNRDIMRKLDKLNELRTNDEEIMDKLNRLEEEIKNTKLAIKSILGTVTLVYVCKYAYEKLIK